MPDADDQARVAGLRSQCWDNALEAFGTACIFERRAHRLRIRLQILTFSGIALPIIVGATVLAFGAKMSILPGLLVTAGIIGIAQLTLSAWAVAANWVDKFDYARESTAANHRLAGQYEALGRNLSESSTELQHRYDVLYAEDAARSAQDISRDITDKERRMGMRAGLRQYRRNCSACGEQPTSMQPSKCDVCGNF